MLNQPVQFCFFLSQDGNICSRVGPRKGPSETIQFVVSRFGVVRLCFAHPFLDRDLNWSFTGGAVAEGIYDNGQGNFFRYVPPRHAPTLL